MSNIPKKFAQPGFLVTFAAGVIALALTSFVLASGAGITMDVHEQAVTKRVYASAQQAAGKEIGDLKSALIKVEKEKTAQTQEVETLKTRLANVNTGTEVLLLRVELEKNSKAYAANLKLVENKLDMSKSALNKSKNENTVLQKTNEDLSSQLATIREKECPTNAPIMRELEKIKTENGELRKANGILNNKLKAATGEVGTLTNRLTKSATEIATLQTKVKSLGTKIKGLETKLAAAQSGSDGVVSTLQSELAASVITINKLKTDNQILTTRLAKMSRNDDTEVKTLKSDLMKSNATIAILNTQIKDLQSKLKAALSSNGEEVSTLKSKLLRLETKYNALKNANVNLTAQVRTHKAALATLKETCRLPIKIEGRTLDPSKIAIPKIEQ